MAMWGHVMDSRVYTTDLRCSEEPRGHIPHSPRCDYAIEGSFAAQRAPFHISGVLSVTLGAHPDTVTSLRANCLALLCRH